MTSPNVRRVVRYRNRKLYEAAERRFVTIHDLARSAAQGVKIDVRDADTGADLTARILSRALASEKTETPASTDAITRLLRAGSDAVETVAGVVERVGGPRVAATVASVRRSTTPERLAESLSPLTRRLETARHDVERIVGGLVGRGTLTWEEGARLKDDVGAVFRDSLGDVLARVRELLSHIPPSSPDLAREIADLKSRLDQLEALAAESFASREASDGAGTPRPVASPETSRNRNRKEKGRKTK